MDLFDALDCALRGGYLKLDALPSAPIWNRMPDELRVVMSEALAAGGPPDTLRRLWQVRAQLLGKPETSSARTKATVALRLGLLALRHQEGRIETLELLRCAFHIADSYVCDVDARPFIRLEKELAAGGSDGGRVAALFAPYTSSAEHAVQEWGLRPGLLS